MTPRATRGEDVAELSALADELLEQATEIRRQWAALHEALGLDAPDVDGPAAADDASAADAADPEMVRLVALDLMLAGTPHDDVRAHLVATFGDAPIVDATVADVFAEG